MRMPVMRVFCSTSCTRSMSHCVCGTPASAPREAASTAAASSFSAWTAASS